MDSKSCSRNEPEQTSDSVSSSDSSIDPKFGGQPTSKRVNDDEVGIEEQKKRRRRNEEGVARGRAKGSEKGKVNRNIGNKQPPQLQPVVSSSPAPSVTEQISAASSCSAFSPKCARSPETEVEEKRTSDGECAPKVPPLKIVIPSAENETAVKSGKSRTAQQALPYIVSASSPCSEKEGAMSPGEDKKDGDCGDKASPNGRVTRSSQKTGVSNSKSPSPAPTPEVGEGSEHGTPVKNEEPVKQEDISQSVHPRKRKIKKPAEPEVATVEPVASVAQPNPPATEPQPFVNSVEEFLKIRKQVEQRRRNLVPVKIKPPQGFKDYLMNRCSYVLAGNASSRMAVAMLATPQSLPTSMQELFTQQEKERYKLRMQHLVEKEKLVLSVEQEILRVHGRAARAAANQSLPYSACTILKDEEIYNPITPEQEAKESNARSRFTGRLLLSWLQDVDDKWEKIKEAMLLRHHNEAESLHAVQKMDWEWRLKEMGLCEPKVRPVIDESSVPMVQVSDDFDLLPA